MAEASNRVPSTQRAQRPEAVVPRGSTDTTAELGAEGGSYGELTQDVRANEQSAATGPNGQSPGRILLIACIVAILAAAILAIVFWA